MYTLFNNPPVSRRGTLTVPRFDYLRRELRKNLEKVVGYYRVSPMYYSSRHLLVQILQHINVSLHQDLVRYRDLVEDLTDDLSRSLHLTSPTNVGRLQSPGVFYGKDSEEVLVVDDSPFSLDQVRDDWENLTPIRFLRHPKTDLTMQVPDGDQYSAETGLAVILVNIPMLACQYREWKLRELYHNPENPRTAMQFLGLYPLTNSVASQVDVAFINRFIALYNDQPVLDTRDNHPFYLNHYEDPIDKEIAKIQLVLAKRALDFDQTLEALVPIAAESFREVIALPSMPMTRQVTWALLLARLPLITWLVQWNLVNGHNRNRHALNVIRRALIEFRNDSAHRQGLPPALVKQVTTEIEVLEGLLP